MYDLQVIKFKNPSKILSYCDINSSFGEEYSFNDKTCFKSYSPTRCRITEKHKIMNIVFRFTQNFKSFKTKSTPFTNFSCNNISLETILSSSVLLFTIVNSKLSNLSSILIANFPHVSIR